METAVIIASCVVSVDEELSAKANGGAYISKLFEGQLAAVSARWHGQEGHYRTVDMLEALCGHVSA